MRILIVRHGDPDYQKDSLTERGWAEARALADRLEKLEVKEFYCSPLGRAKDTASVTLERLHREAVICPWLMEFCPPVIQYPGTDKEHICWDWLPEDWTTVPLFYDEERWSEHPAFTAAHVREAYDEVTGQWDALLAKHGYERRGKCYHVTERNRDTIVLFCHFGLECVLLSRLLSMSPMILWHGFVAAPTAVTTIYTEERRDGTASFRIQSFGDLSHLYQKGLQPSFAARFCEAFDDLGERID